MLNPAPVDVPDISENTSITSQPDVVAPPHRTPLLKGNAHHIVAANIQQLKNQGLAEHHATHLALKFANMGKRTVKNVVKAAPMKLRMGK